MQMFFSCIDLKVSIISLRVVFSNASGGMTMNFMNRPKIDETTAQKRDNKYNDLVLG